MDNFFHTTLQDLPVELLEMILMKTISMIVMSKNLPRSARDEELCQVLFELRSVWSEWNYRLTTEWFKIVFQRQLTTLGSMVYKDHPVFIKKFDTKGRVQIQGLSILDGEVFLLKHDDRRIDGGIETSEMEVYDSTSFRLNRSWKIEEMSNPSDLVSSRRDKCLYIVHWAGESRNGKEFLKVHPDGRIINRWFSGSNFGFNVSVTYESNILLSVYDENKLIEYSSEGQIISEITIRTDIRHTLGPKHAVKLTNGHFAIAYIGVLTGIWIVDMNGEVLETFDRTFGSTNGDEHFLPNYFVSDGEGSILVADLHRGVYLLSPVLEFKREILAKGHQEISDVLKVALDRSNGRLFVTQYRGVLVFDIK